MADWDFHRADGTNASFSFSQAGNASSFNLVRLRARKVDYSWEVVATESHGRINRAFYPHQRAVGKFAVTLELKGYNEFKPFSDFMFNYIRTFMGADQKSMFVAVPVRGFARWGVPVSGVYDGDHVGSMVFNPTIIFEGMNDPLDEKIITGAPDAASWDMGGATGDQASFFYPFSQGSLNANTRPETVYDTGMTGGLTGISGALSWAAGQISGNVLSSVDQMLRDINDQIRAGQ